MFKNIETHQINLRLTLDKSQFLNFRIHFRKRLIIERL